MPPLQNTFNEYMASAFPGQWYDISDTEAYGRTVEGSSIPFGVAVVSGTNDNQVRLPDHGGYLESIDPEILATDPAENRFLGITMYHAPNARGSDSAPLAKPIGDGDKGYLAVTETASVATAGRGYVIPETDVKKGDPVFFRHTLTDAAAVPQTECLGMLRNDDDGGNATQILGARFATSSLAGELTVVQLSGAAEAAP